MDISLNNARAAVELAHTPGPQINWQESIFLAWWDDQHGIGGVHRIGHVINQGAANLWCGFFTSKGHCYRRNVEMLPLAEGDRLQPIFRAGIQTFSYEDCFRLRVEDNDVHADLKFEDFYPPDEVFQHSKRTAVEANVCADHNESTGWLRGRLRMGNDEFEINALAHRDHSWGPRDWYNINAHRWVAGSCGPDLSFTIAIMAGNDGDALYAAYVNENGRVRKTTDFDIVTYMEWDAVSNRGGQVELRFEDGSKLNLDCEPVGPGFVFTKDEYIAHDCLCRVTTADGRIGFCDFEVSNGRRNTRLPASARGINRDGLKLPA